MCCQPLLKTFDTPPPGVGGVVWEVKHIREKVKPIRKNCRAAEIFEDLPSNLIEKLKKMTFLMIIYQKKIRLRRAFYSLSL